MDFYAQAGKVALGSRLRRLSERITANAGEVFHLYGVGLDPKWFPVFYLLLQRGEASITEIAQRIGHTHPSVSQIVGEMKRQGLARSEKSESDGRINVVRLTHAGKALGPALEEQCTDVAHAVETLLSQARCNLWNAIEETEYLLEQRSLLQRVRDARKERAKDQVEIIDYGPAFHDDFKRLHREWIEVHWTLEEADLKALEHPDTYVLDGGGFILLARCEGRIVGTCAAIKMDEFTFELAKMAVTQSEKGKGIGWLLGRAVIERAQQLGAKKIYLESNTVLGPAISLYQKLGFKKTVTRPSPYARCNIQMELSLAP